PIQQDLTKMIKTNIEGTVNLLEAVNKYKYLSFVNTGTSSEYGYKQKPMKETDILEPAFNYAATKASATLICQVFAKQFNKPIVTLRPFSIYGDWEEPSRFIPTIITSCLKGKTVNLIPGKQVRDFLYVEDLIRAYLVTGLKTNLGGEVINIGSGKQVLVKQTAEKIINLVGNKVKVNIGTYKPRSWDTNYWVADRSKAKKLLGWEPQYTLEDGLKKSIDWYQTRLNV
ncbi:NAD-dependent epimerase/dehydratase family protein, partial [Patescibacteria group bacterium]|nr:NAD-dependent epimerase/dehydratase family protein [Patescibacteria group bacterium]